MAKSNECDEDAPLLFSTRHGDNGGGLKKPEAPEKKHQSQGQPFAEKKSVDEKWILRIHDLEYRRKFFRSIYMCLGMFCMGLATSQLGPAFLDLQLITKTTVEEASFFFTAGSAGDIVGSVFSGFIYDHLSKTLLPIASLQMMGLMFLVIPFCSNYWLMISACFVLFVSRQSVALVATADILRMWGARGTTFMHAIHFMLAVGAVVAPLITEPFLAPRNQTATDNYSNHSIPPEHNHTSGFDLDFVTDVTPPEVVVEPESGTRIQFAFYISSTICFLLSLPLLVDSIKDRLGRTKQTNPSQLELPNEIQKTDSFTSHVCSKGNKEDDDASQKHAKEKDSTSDLPIALYIVTVMCIILFFFIFVGSSLMAWAYLTTFSVLQMGWTKSRGAFLHFAYWIAVTFGRFISIFLAKSLTSMQLLVISFVLLLPSLVGFILMSLNLLDWGVWICAMLCGVSLAPMYANSVSWINARLLRMTGKVTCCIDMASAAGRLATFAVQGVLIGNHGAIWFVYIILIEAVLSCLILLCLFLFSRLYLEPKYGARYMTKE